MAVTSNLNSATRARLENELEQLRAQREALAPRLSEESLGDSADQADMLERAKSAAWLDRRIRDIEELLRDGITPDDDSGLPGGTQVKLRFDDDSVETMKVVSIAEEAGDEDAVVTPDSPLGQALTGRQTGDIVSYHTPVGEETVTIEELTIPRQRKG